MAKSPPAERTEANDNALVHFIQTNGRFPTHSTDEALTDYMRELGGRMKVYVELLDGKTRESLARNGQAPAIFPMESWILKADVVADEDLVRSILGIHLRYYDKTDSPGVLSRLRAKNDPKWNQFLDSNPLSALRDPCGPNLTSLSSSKSIPPGSGQSPAPAGGD